MNAPEKFQVPENTSSIDKAALFDFRDGFIQLRKFAEQKASGADVVPELEELKESLFARLAKAVEDIEGEGESKGSQVELPHV